MNSGFCLTLCCTPTQKGAEEHDEMPVTIEQQVVNELFLFHLKMLNFYAAYTILINE